MIKPSVLLKYLHDVNFQVFRASPDLLNTNFPESLQPIIFKTKQQSFLAYCHNSLYPSHSHFICTMNSICLHLFLTSSSEQGASRTTFVQPLLAPKTYLFGLIMMGHVVRTIFYLKEYQGTVFDLV